jgi:heme exporter protein CcmD
MHLDFDTGKYGVYIWTCYGAAVVVMGGLVADTLLRSGRWRREAERLEAARKTAKTKTP